MLPWRMEVYLLQTIGRVSHAERHRTAGGKFSIGRFRHRRSHLPALLPFLCLPPDTARPYLTLIPQQPPRRLIPYHPLILCASNPPKILTNGAGRGVKPLSIPTNRQRVARATHMRRSPGRVTSFPFFPILFLFTSLFYALILVFCRRGKGGRSLYNAYQFMPNG